MLWIDTNRLLLTQLREQGYEFDQKLSRAFEVSASDPNLEPEDSGFPDSYLTLALYRLNSVLTRIAQLDESRLNLFHEYKLAPLCDPEAVRPGERLGRVLQRAAEIAAPEKTIGSGHFLKAVVALTLDEEPAPSYGFPGQVLHQTFSAETLLWGLGHTAWTPVSDAPEIGQLLAQLDGRNLVEDFQYILTLEGDRMVFRPTSLLDSYPMLGAHGGVTERSAVLSHFRDRYAGVTADEILELEDLINHPRAQEDDLQRFFEKHPYLLRMWDYREVTPHVFLTREEAGPLIPDFLLLDPDLQRAMVLELKLPSARTVVSQRNRDRFSSLISEARSQLLEYRDWFEDKHNRQSVKEEFGMEIFRPRLGVLVGRGSDFAGDLQRQKLSSRHPDIEIATYDDILRHAERRLLLVASAEHG
jgi:hypothetical protein